MPWRDSNPVTSRLLSGALPTIATTLRLSRSQNNNNIKFILIRRDTRSNRIGGSNAHDTESGSTRGVSTIRVYIFICTDSIYGFELSLQSPVNRQR